MSTWRIEVRTIATPETPGPEVFFQRGFGAWVEIAIYCFILRSGKSTILIDTGFAGAVYGLNRRIRTRKGKRAGFHLKVADIWQDLDETPSAVAVTSFGPYAAGGLARCPEDLPLFASARGLADLSQPEEPALVHALPKAASEVLRSRATATTGSREIAPGVIFHEVGVHHPASAAIEIATGAGPLVIADPVFTARNLIDRVALGAAENAASWYAMVRRLAQGEKRFLPIHDPQLVPVRVLPRADGEWRADLMHDQRVCI